jgi:hypothetical protein
MPCNQFVLELSMHLQKYNRCATCSVAAYVFTCHVCYAARVCTYLICYATCICMHPNCYAACLCLLKTRVSFFLKTYDPLLLLSHRSVTCHYIQTVTIPYACILIHNLYSRKICLSPVMCHIGVLNQEQVYFPSHDLIYQTLSDIQPLKTSTNIRSHPCTIKTLIHMPRNTRCASTRSINDKYTNTVFM